MIYRYNKSIRAKRKSQKEKAKKMRELDTQRQEGRTSERHYLGKQYSVICEVLLGTVVAGGATVIARIFLTEAWSVLTVIYVLILAFCIVPLLFVIGGSRYEVWGRDLVIRVGFLRIPEKKIPLASITRIYADKYVGRPPCTYCGHFGFWGKIVVIHTDSAKYSLATKDPTKLIAQIEKFLRVQKPSTAESG